MKNREAPEHAADKAALPEKDHIPKTKSPGSGRSGKLTRSCHRTELRVLTGLLIVAALLLAGACGSDNVTGPDPSVEPEIPGIALTPAEGPPGTIVVVESPVLAGADVSTLGATIGGYPAPIRVLASGDVQAVIPILAAGERGNAPPDEPISVELLDGDETIARSELAFTVTVLPKAPGAADSLREDLTLISGRLSELAKELDLKGSAFFGYAEAILGGLEALLVGDPEESLAAQLERLATEDPETLALVEGVLAASGAVDATRKLAEALASISVAVDLAGAETAAIQPLTSLDGSTPWAASRTLEHSASSLDVDISDVRLASKMQFYVVAKLLGETVVGETAESYAASVGLISGALGMGVSIPAASIIGAILGVANFAVNKVFLGVFPAELSRFDLVLEENHLEPGDTTTARFDLQARNAPPEVGIQDFISLTLDLIGIAQGVGRLEAHDSFRQVLQHTAAFYLTTIRSALAGYASEHPELNLDVSFELIPDMTWTAVAHDPRLVDVLTHTPDVVTPFEDELNWHAAGPELGEGRIYARTATGDGAVLIDLPPGFTYTGGAFGESVLATETRSVYVVGDLVLEVDFPETITDDDIVALEVRAGHSDAEDEPVWKPGIEVSLIVDGGTVEHSEGVTDGDGQFITLAQLLPESDRIIITVVVRDDFDQEAVETVEATTPSGDASVVVLGGNLAAKALHHVRVGDYGPGYAPIDSGDRTEDMSGVDGPGEWSVLAESGEELTHPVTGDEASASASSSIQLNIQIPAGGDQVAVFTGNAHISAEANGEDPNSASAGAFAIDLVVYFEVVGAPVDYELTSTFDGSPRGVNFLDEFYHSDPNGDGIVAPQLSGTLVEGKYVIDIRNLTCSASPSSGGESECTESYDFSIVLTR